MESADRSAGDGNKAKRKNLPGEHRAASIDEARQRRHQHVRTHKQNSSGERENRASLDEGAQIIPRSKQQPNRER